MTVRDIQRILEEWAPKELAWERDNVGLLLGSLNKRVRRILVCLDVTDEVVAEARAKKVDLVISHHPLLFHPMKAVNEEDRVGRIVQQLIGSHIALYAAHTNLDFTHSGVSFALAERLGLQNVEVLQKDQEIYNKLVVFVPAGHGENVMHAMADAGAGTIGKYEQCSFHSEGKGTFKALGNAEPFIGKVGQLETVAEIRLEMILPHWKLDAVLGAMRTAHPYEEIAYDVYALKNKSQVSGAGVIGEWEPESNVQTFLKKVRSSLHAGGIRYTGDTRRRIKRVAVCGGGGSELLRVAIQRGADAFVTADVSYHTFERVDSHLVLVDAGHFETEQPIVGTIVKYLKNHGTVFNEGIQIVASRRARNPVQYYPS